MISHVKGSDPSQFAPGIVGFALIVLTICANGSMTPCTGTSRSTFSFRCSMFVSTFSPHRCRCQVGVVEVGLHQDPVARHVGEQVRPLARVVEQVIELHLHRRVLERQLSSTSSNFGGLRVLRQRVGHDGVRARHQILEERLVAAVRDDRQPFGHRDAQPARVIEMVMRHDRRASAASD